jgi:heparanase
MPVKRKDLRKSRGHADAIKIYLISCTRRKSNSGTLAMQLSRGWTRNMSVMRLIARCPSRVARRGLLEAVIFRCCGYVAFALVFWPVSWLMAASMPSVMPSSMPRIGTVDERFQSYNIEMVEITGGRFWKPYRSRADDGPADSGTNAPQGMDARLVQYRPPIDLTGARLRMLAAALGPAYVRISGTWANTTYFADQDEPPALPPAGFKGILTRPQWHNVVDFAQAVDARIVTSFAISAGSRDAAGVWAPDQARRLLAYTHAIGGKIAAAEFMNEPDLAAMGGAPAGYDTAAYSRDFKLFRSVIKSTTPQTMILGPGATGQATIASQLLAASGPGLDAFSYHYYHALSVRCGGKGPPDAVLSEDGLAGTDQALVYNKKLRDRFAPGKPIWLTETADAACGGNPWAASFVDAFRYLDQLGRLARAGVQVVMHNTLAASDYGLLDENTLQPRPKYWGALLWRRLMGRTVLDDGVPLQAGLHVYAHCLRGIHGGVALLIINTDRTASHQLILAGASLRYTLDAVDVNGADVRLNGRTLTLNASGGLANLEGAPASAGVATFDPATITFLAISSANNSACRQSA